MSDQIIANKQLRAVYLLLSVLVIAAATKSLIWPRWPAAQPLDQQAIRQALNDAGFQAKPLSPLAAKRTAEIATSAAIGYSLDNGVELRLMRGVARRRFNFQIAFFTQSHSELDLKKRQIVSTPLPYAVGLIQKQSVLQTCLVQENPSAKAFGATQEELTILVDSANQNKWNALKSFAGLRPNRDYQCTLIQAKSKTNSAKPIDQLNWLRMLSVLRSALHSESSHSSNQNI
jgi:hypothetical protein